jgi:hypothetical protein
VQLHTLQRDQQCCSHAAYGMRGAVGCLLRPLLTAAAALMGSCSCRRRRPRSYVRCGVPACFGLYSLLLLLLEWAPVPAGVGTPDLTYGVECQPAQASTHCCCCCCCCLNGLMFLQESAPQILRTVWSASLLGPLLTAAAAAV